MSTERRGTAALLFLLLLLAVSIALLQKGFYGWTVFVAVPLCAGGLVSWACRPATSLRALGLGALTGAAGCLLLLLLNREGIACVVMALPLVAPLSAFGSWLVYISAKLDASRPEVAMLLLLPGGFWFDTTAHPSLYAVRTSVVVNAPPQRVWKNVVAFSEIPDPQDWLFRTGLAYPKRARIDGSGRGAVRHCDFSTGQFVEPITIWDEPHLLQFRVTANAPPMQETGLYGRIYPKHLSGYLISKRGQFRLSALPGGRTLLEGTTWYQHGLWPAQYWRLWSDVIIHGIHSRVLNHVRALSEQTGSGQ